ncbi:hypothetical protein QYF61_014625 [Mycteria americana]|uniref:Uncharacterized protein n=1 Tax=Mycteria americana TaxID=33587 RepID=A0AAN7RX47_MYCAM|nr:hypothetical protein QYF61_014625 [Mycteria americana]
MCQAIESAQSSKPGCPFPGGWGQGPPSPGLSEDPSVVGLLRVEEQQVPIATTTVHRRQYRTNRDSLIPMHELIHRLESQAVISKTRPPFNSPIWPVQKSNGEWRPTVDYHGLNEVMPPLPCRTCWNFNMSWSQKQPNGCYN